MNQSVLIFATNNQHKVDEIKVVVPDHFQILSLKEAGIDIDIPEPFITLEANATEKSTTIYRLTHQNCFSEDTGLEVDALNGAPGVKSARFAGEGRNFQDNIDKLLTLLTHIEYRGARFKTVASLIWNGKEHQFIGICEGRITESPRGINGFGYDSVFIPEGSTKTFAEMNMEEKNSYSHRKKAVDQLVDFLNAQVGGI